MTDSLTTITTTTGALRQALERTAPFAAGDDSRPTLHGVQIRIDQQGVRFAGADGSVLGFQRLNGADISGSGTVIIRLPDAKAAIKALPKTKRAADDPVTITWEDYGPIRITAESVTLECERVEGSAPNYDSVVPTVGPTAYTPGPYVALNPALLLKVCRAAGIGMRTVRVYVQEPRSPIVGGTLDGFGFVLMPMFVEMSDKPGDLLAGIVGTPLASTGD